MAVIHPPELSSALSVKSLWTEFREIFVMAEWAKIGLPVLAAILSAYVMIQGHDIKITRLEADMRTHLDEHKKESKDAFEKLSRIEIAIERIETKVESIKFR